MKNQKSLWIAINHHRTHKNKPITFDKHYYLRAIYIDKSPFVIIEKSTQCGISEFLIVRVIGEADDGRSVFYALPTFDLKNRFVQNRFNRSVIFTPHYQKLLREAGDVKSAESMSLKHISRGSVAFVGSNTPVPFTEYPADTYVIDEYDLCDQKNILMGEERLSASESARKIYVGNPTLADFGIDGMFNGSDKKEWFIPCSHCGHYINPDFFKHVVQQVDASNWILRDGEWDRSMDRDINPICHLCDHPFDRFVDGEWVEEGVSHVSGYHISKMFSTNTTLVEMADKFNKGLYNNDVMVRFYNGDLGKGYSAQGAQVTIDMIRSCIADYTMPPGGCLDDLDDGINIMGVDVGVVMHVKINKLMNNGNIKSIYLGSVSEYDDLLYLYNKFKIKVGVIDALPESRLSKKVVATMKGMWMAFYSDVKRDLIDPRFKIVTIERTASLDAVSEAIMTKSILFPRNIESLPEYCTHMQSMTRVLDDSKGLDKSKYVWKKVGPDHLFHAENYAFIAKKLLIMLAGR